MTFFESLLALLLLSIALLQFSRRVRIPYPTMLAAAGMLVVLVPGAPRIALDPGTVLALFIAPTLLDAAYDFPGAVARRFWRPLLVLAGGGVLLTALLVAWLGWWYAGLPFAAALVLGAIVAPPDAVAATAVLSNLSIPRNTLLILKGESLFNDAVALLLFGAALAIQQHGGLDAAVGARLLLEAPAGVLLGIVLASIVRQVTPFVSGTLGGNLLQFVTTCVVWLLAARLGVSPVLCVVAYAMTLARSRTGGSPRMRIHSFAVWATVVFLLNVLAFLFMGMQVRTILQRMQSTRLDDALAFAALVVLTVVLVRFVVVMLSNRAAARFSTYRGGAESPSLRAGVLLGWCGMRGLVTLATALALPADFPRRDLIALVAFTVVMATLLLQGLTLGPLIRLLRLDRSAQAQGDLESAREKLALAGLARLETIPDGAATVAYQAAYRLRLVDGGADGRARHDAIGREAIAAERACLADLLHRDAIDTDLFYALLEELDWRELALLPDAERRIEES